MKPKINDRKCGASESMCTIIRACPVDAVSYIEVDEPITDREVNCNLPKTESPTTDCGCGCECGDGAPGGCGENPYSRIVIDYQKCTGCGICADICCGSAIEMVG